MSIFRTFDISASALAANRERMNILSSNLANAQTTRTPASEGGGPYRRRDVVFSAIPTDTEMPEYLDESSEAQLRKVKVVDIHKDMAEPRRVFDPSHADADKDGYVSMPNINVMTEMVNMIAATRAYEANATAIDDAKQMALKSLEIGR